MRQIEVRAFEKLQKAIKGLEAEQAQKDAETRAREIEEELSVVRERFIVWWLAFPF